MRYWDTSALVPLLVEEPESARIRQLLKEDTAIVAWWATPVEMFSAICRSQREGQINEEEMGVLRTRFSELIASLDLVTPTLALRNRALRLLSVSSLRAADALQLAAALRWCHEETEGMPFVALDGRLRQAAAGEGFAVSP